MLAVSLSVYYWLLSISITDFRSNVKRALVNDLLWTRSRRHKGLWCGYPPKQNFQPPNRKMKYYKSVEFVNFENFKPRCTKIKPLFLKTFSTVHWNYFESIQSYIKQPVSLLGFNTAQSWKSLLWPGCGKWNGQHIVAILVVSSTILAQHAWHQKQCGYSNVPRSTK